MSPTSRTARSRALLFGAVLALAACRQDTPTSPAALAAPAATAPSLSLAGNGVWAEDVSGSTAGGSLYRMLVPVNWNGEVVFYAHGFRDVAAPVVLGEEQDNFDDLRDWLGGKGYAVAYSSWRENGVATQEGALATHQLRGLFASNFGQPARAYLAGHSLGGLVAVRLAEKYPQQYDGVLPMCGPVGGMRAEAQYLADTRALWDVFFPGTLPGDAGSLPPITDVNAQIVGPVVAAITTQPGGFQRAGAITRFAQTPVPFVTNAGPVVQGQTLVGSLAYVLAFHARGLDDLTSRTHGHLPYDNMNTVYAGPLDAATLGFVNATVKRFATTPDAQNFLDRNYEPTGELRIPTLSVHTALDPAVPLFHEDSLRARVARAGRADMLLQRTTPAYGHCTFQLAEMQGAFTALETWVRTGVKPAS